MLQDGGYLLTSQLLGYEKKKVIWSTGPPLTLEKSITPRKFAADSEDQLSPRCKVQVMRKQTSLGLAFERKESPQLQFSPHRVFSNKKKIISLTSPPSNTSSASKAAAILRMDKLRKRRLQLSCRAINSLEELAQSWSASSSVKSSTKSHVQTRPNKKKTTLTSPRECRIRAGSSTNWGVSKQHTSKTLPATTKEDQRIKSLTTLDKKLITQLASQFSIPNDHKPKKLTSSLSTNEKLDASNRSGGWSFLQNMFRESQSNCNQINKSKKVLEEENKEEKEDDDTSEKSAATTPRLTFASIAQTKNLLSKTVKNQRVITDLKLDGSALRKQHHSADAIARIHGFLAEQDIGKLMNATGYSRSQLYHQFLRFKALCTVSESPEGINQASFRAGLPSLSFEDGLFVNRVFEVIDSERRGILDWPHYIHAMACLEQGTPVARTAFLWKVYDTGGDGTISREELKTFFVSSLMTTVDDFIEDVAEIFVEGVFSRITPNEKGDLTLSEAMQYIDRQNEVSDLHGMFGRSMAMQGFAEIVDGNKSHAASESEKERIARNIRKMRRKEGLGLLEANEKTGAAKAKQRSHHQSMMINAAKTKREKYEQKNNKTSRERLMSDDSDAELDVDLNQELADMHRDVMDSTQLSPCAAKRRASVVFEQVDGDDEARNEYRLRYGSLSDTKVKAKRKVVKALKPITKKVRSSVVRGRTTDILSIS